MRLLPVLCWPPMNYRAFLRRCRRYGRRPSGFTIDAYVAMNQHELKPRTCEKLMYLASYVREFGWSFTA
ncbi:MAG: hypothetical protein AAF597_17050 [Bacteroidota bacterium]